MCIRDRCRARSSVKLGQLYKGPRILAEGTKSRVRIVWHLHRMSDDKVPKRVFLRMNRREETEGEL